MIKHITFGETSIGLGEITRVSGRNGSGKTTLARAILWALTGMTPALDPDSSAFAAVVVDVNGVTIARTPGEVRIDGAKIPMNALAEVLGCHPKAWAIMFWPESFFVLNQAQRRSMFDLISGNIDVSAILAEKFPNAQIPEIILKQGQKALDKYCEERKASERKLAMAAGQLHECEIQGKTIQEQVESQHKIQTEAYAKACAMQADLPKPDPKRLAELQKELAVAKGHVDLIEGKYLPIEALVKQSKSEKLRSDICPTCGRKYDNVEAYQARVEAKLREFEKQLLMLTNERSAALTYFFACKRDLAVEEERARPVAPLPIEPPPIDELVAKATTEMQARKRKLEAEIAELKLAHAQRVANEEALHPKSGVFALALEKKLASISLPGFVFQFTETQKNGTEIDSFSITRASDGCPVDCLSSGERIKFCLQLSQLIAGLTGSKLRSIFLEHADLLDAVPRVQNFQIIGEKVTKDDFKVEIIK